MNCGGCELAWHLYVPLSSTDTLEILSDQSCGKKGARTHKSGFGPLIAIHRRPAEAHEMAFDNTNKVEAERAAYSTLQLPVYVHVLCSISD